MAESFDVVVIGGGPGGYVAAVRAAQLGARVAVVERGGVGGTCLRRGCIPTKSLLSSAHAFSLAKRGSEFGFSAEAVTPDFAAMTRRAQGVVSRLGDGVANLLAKHKVQVMEGEGRLDNPTGAGFVVKVRRPDGRDEALVTEKVILATGSRAAILPELGYDGTLVITSDEAIGLSELPASLVIIGGGVIGCEFASLFSALGTQVTVVEPLPQLLGPVEGDVARQLASYFRRRGMTVYTGTKVEQVTKGAGTVRVQLSNGEAVEAERVLLAVGRRANTQSLRLQVAGVAANERGEIVVDERMATSVPGIFAVGDATNAGWKLAHVASQQGLVAAANAMGHDEQIDYQVVPNVVYSFPEVASVGLTSEQAKAAGLSVKVGKFSFVASGRAVAAGETEGFVKLLAEADSGRLVGAHLIAPQASELVAEVALAVRWGLTIEQLVQTIHAHPTYYESIFEAAQLMHA